jgi:hypothetical protein
MLFRIRHFREHGMTLGRSAMVITIRYAIAALGPARQGTSRRL